MTVSSGKQDSVIYSYSRITQYDLCPYAWFLKYISHEKSDDELFFSRYGRFMHELLADFNSGKATKNEIKLRYLTEFSQAVGLNAPNEKILPRYINDGLYAIDTAEKFGETVNTEEFVLFKIGDHKFRGYIDLVSFSESESPVAIVDHKSKLISEKVHKSGPLGCAESEKEKYLRQLYVYAEAVKQKYGCYPNLLIINCFRGNYRITEPFSKDKMEDVKEWAEKKIHIINADEEYIPDIEFFKCKYLCDMHNSCEYYESGGTWS